LQVPAPSQVELALSVEPLQLAARQTVPAIHLRQAPAPSQVPSLPQLEAAEAGHSLCGLVPGSANLHVPMLFVALQVWQVLLQAVLQQTPSTQNPLPQSVFAAHDVPHWDAPHAYAPHD